MVSLKTNRISITNYRCAHTAPHTAIRLQHRYYYTEDSVAYKSINYQTIFVL